MLQESSASFFLEWKVEKYVQEMLAPSRSTLCWCCRASCCSRRWPRELVLRPSCILPRVGTSAASCPATEEHSLPWLLPPGITAGSPREGSLSALYPPHPPLKASPVMPAHLLQAVHQAPPSPTPVTVPHTHLFLLLPLLVSVASQNCRRRPERQEEARLGQPCCPLLPAIRGWKHPLA